MSKTNVAALVTVAVMSTIHGAMALPDDTRADLAGRWTLNRDLSQFPEVGFGMDLLSGTAGGSGSSSGSAGGGGSRGRRSSGGVGPSTFASFRESQEDAKRRELLVDEVRNPPAQIAIAQSEATVTISDDRGRSRTLHADGKEESQRLDQTQVATTTKWDGPRLVILYHVEQNRELQYTYSRRMDPPQLLLEVQFIERGDRETVNRVYEPARAAMAPPDRAAAPDVPQANPTKPSDTQPSGLAKPPSPASPRTPAPALARGPDAALKGLTALGVVVEDLSGQAAACGLNQSAIEAAVSKSLSDAGFKVLRNSDEDTYVYVHVMTTSVSPALCVSRYDAFLYTNTTATLSYQTAPVLAQVLLLNNGGLSGGPPGAHADAVIRGVKQYVDEFATRIRNANR